MAIEQKISSDKLHFINGFLLVHANKFKEGEKEFVQAIKLNPFVSAYYYNLASIYMKHKFFNKSITVLLQAIELEPDNEQIFLSLAQSYFLNNNIEKSLDIFKRITLFAPTSINGYIGLGKLHLKLNQYNQTLKYFKRALNYDSSALTFFNILEVYFQKYFYFILFFCAFGFFTIFFTLKKYYKQCPKL